MTTINHPHQASYISYLCALAHLLKNAENKGDQFWYQWLVKDIDLWKKDKDVSHHLSAYGGMGSFSDTVGPMSINQIKLNENQRTWIHTLYILLQDLCYTAAHKPDHCFTLNELKNKFKPPSDLSVYIGVAEMQSKKSNKRSYSQLSAADYGCLKTVWDKTEDTYSTEYVREFILPLFITEACAEDRVIELIDEMFSVMGLANFSGN